MISTTKWKCHSSLDVLLASKHYLLLDLPGVLWKCMRKFAEMTLFSKKICLGGCGVFSVLYSGTATSLRTVFSMYILSYGQFLQFPSHRHHGMWLCFLFFVLFTSSIYTVSTHSLYLVSNRGLAKFLEISRKMESGMGNWEGTGKCSRKHWNIPESWDRIPRKQREISQKHTWGKIPAENGEISCNTKCYSLESRR